MRAGECEIRKTSVIEARNLPAVGCMTRFASGWESGGAMIEYAVLLKLAGVATNALRTESDVLPNRCAGMTGIARKSGVCTDEREAIPMVLNRACVHAPPLNGVAVLALGAELPLVEIRVAIGAAGAGFGKNFRYMARITRYILVHATELKMGF
jgi:hypothetical protein